MTISSGFTVTEIRELVHEYQMLPYGTKESWLIARGVSYKRMRRWRDAVFEGDLDRGLIPREGSDMTVPPSKRTALERERARERAAQAAEVERLTARVRELEDTNEALGKAIGLLHARNGQEPDATPTTSGLDSSSTSTTDSSSS